MLSCERKWKRFGLFGRALLFLTGVVVFGVPKTAQAEAGPQDRGYYAMRPPAASVAGLSGQMQPVILPLEEGYYRYNQGDYVPHYAGSAYDDYPASQPYPPHVLAMPENSAAAPEWGAYDDWGGWQEYVGR